MTFERLCKTLRRKAKRSWQRIPHDFAIVPGELSRFSLYAYTVLRITRRKGSQNEYPREDILLPLTDIFSRGKVGERAEAVREKFQEKELPCTLFWL